MPNYIRTYTGTDIHRRSGSAGGRKKSFLINELQAHFDINLPISIYWLLDSVATTTEHTKEQVLPSYTRV